MDNHRTEFEEAVYRLDGPLRWSLGENTELVSLANIQPGWTVLDIGSGTGYLSLPLAKAVGYHGRVYSLDLNNNMHNVLLKKAKKQGLDNRIKSIITDASNLEFSDAFFDCVVSSYTFHEIGEKLPGVLKEVHRVLKPLHSLVIADYRRIPDNQKQREIENWYNVQKDGAGDDEVHLRFSLEEMELKLLNAGFALSMGKTWADFHMHILAKCN